MIKIYFIIMIIVKDAYSISDADISREFGSKQNFTSDFPEVSAMDRNEQKSLPDIKVTHSSDFREVLKTDVFIDKSLLIRKFLEKPHEVPYITAPINYGKSTNLDMLQKFLEYELDKNGKPLTKETVLEKPIKDTPNYRLFMENKLKITKYVKTMEEHFGKYLIIKIDLGGPILMSSFNGLMFKYKDEIRDNYKKHIYLLKSKVLDDSEKQLIKNWSSIKKSHLLYENNVTYGIQDLASYLFRHHRRHIFIFIDNQGQQLMDIFTGPKLKHHERADYLRFINFKKRLLKEAFKYRDIVYGGFFTSNTPILDAGVSDTIGVQKYRFLDDHQYINYYGLTPYEVNQLLVKKKFQINSLDRTKPFWLYDGYENIDGTKILSIYSVIKFIQWRSLESYWQDHCEVFNLPKVLQIDIIRRDIRRLVKSKGINETLTFEMKQSYTIDDALHLWDIIHKPTLRTNLTNPDLFYSYLYDSGLFSPVRIKKSKLKQFRRRRPARRVFRIPNREVKGFYKESYTIYKDHYKETLYNI